MTTKALKLVLEALTIVRFCVPPAQRPTIEQAITTTIEALAQPERHELQAEGKHPAPCARFCEANAFQIEIRRLKAQLSQPEQEPDHDKK